MSKKNVPWKPLARWEMAPAATWLPVVTVGAGEVAKEAGRPGGLMYWMGTPENLRR